MGIWQRQVVPRITDIVCARADIGELRRLVAADLLGQVLEVGFGSGLNVAYYPPAVTEVLAVDPSLVGRRLARRRLASTPVPVRFVGLDGQELSLPDESVDSALSTFTLCTIPDVGRALNEVRRVLRPGGRLHFLEHGLSPDGRVSRWQHRLTPVQRRLCGGCHLDRPVDELISNHGYEIEELRNLYLKAPQTVGYLYVGVARPE